jgi:hypothetical protein
MDRRRFLRIAGTTGAGVLALSVVPGFLVKGRRARADAFLWSDPDTWGGRVPGPGDVAMIMGQTVILDVDARVAGLIIEMDAALEFDPGSSRTLTSTGNVVVDGRFQMRPSNGKVVHTLLFEGVDESSFVGGGHEVLDSDVGLWVRHMGVLDIVGTPKRAWSRATGAVSPGAQSIVLQDQPRGWRKGDEVAVAPTATGDYEGFEVLKVASVKQSTKTVTFTASITNDHPAVTLPDGRVMTAEVMNLTRNTRIEGTPGGRAHVHLMPEGPQVIRNLQLRHLGPRKSSQAEPVLGRYGLHFHEAGDGSRGSVVAGVVARDLGNHAFVPHESHGITFRNCVAFQVGEDPYWWDRLKEGVAKSVDLRPEDFSQTHNAKFVRCVAADVYDYPAAGGTNAEREGFLHNFGLNNSAVDCAVVGVTASNRASGYFWPAQVQGMGSAAVWRHENCLAHNVRGDGFGVWQISPDVHVIDRATVYRVEVGFSHGSYVNVYNYRDGVAYETSADAMELHASGGESLVDSTVEQRWDRMIFDPAGGAYAVSIGKHSLPGIRPGILEECQLQGYGSAPVLINERSSDPFSRGGSFDFIRCTAQGRDLEATDFVVEDIHPVSVMRVQRRDGTAFQITRAGVKNIDAFDD